MYELIVTGVISAIVVLAAFFASRRYAIGTYRATCDEVDGIVAQVQGLGAIPDPKAKGEEGALGAAWVWACQAASSGWISETVLERARMVHDGLADEPASWGHANEPTDHVPVWMVVVSVVLGCAGAVLCAMTYGAGAGVMLSVIVGLLLVLARVDAYCRTIPDELAVALLAIGVGWRFVCGLDPWSGLVFGVLAAIVMFVMKARARRLGFMTPVGAGDVKLLAIGFTLVGAEGALVACLAMLVVLGGVIAWGRVTKRLDIHSYIPFAPVFSAAIAVTMVVIEVI